MQKQLSQDLIKCLRCHTLWSYLDGGVLPCPHYFNTNNETVIAEIVEIKTKHGYYTTIKPKIR